MKEKPNKKQHLREAEVRADDDPAKRKLVVKRQ